METRTETIELETTRHRIRGDVTLPASGSRSRISDLLNAAEKPFLVVTDAEVVPLDGALPPQRHDVVAVARAHVVLAVPAAL
jgi:hypothetical protein